MAKFQDTLTSTKTTTRNIGAGELGDTSGKPIECTAALQVIRVPATGDFEVKLQAGIPYEPGGQIRWSDVATVTQAKNESLEPFTLVQGAVYRFSYESGTPDVICLLT